MAAFTAQAVLQRLSVETVTAAVIFQIQLAFSEVAGHETRSLHQNMGTPFADPNPYAPQ